jgi:glycosyltransferase involved in cell wall biosynthesis
MDSAFSTMDEKIIGNADSAGSSVTPAASRLRIAICPAELEFMSRVMRGKPAEATYIIQGYVANGLSARGHNLTFVAPTLHTQFICTDDLLKPALAPQTWSSGFWFSMARRVVWRTQRLFGVPYLNVFFNYQIYDSCLQCLPGHDIIYERNGLYRYGVAMACKRLGLPYVLYFEADDIMEHDFMGKPITGLLRWRAKKAIRYNLDAADCVICVSEPGKAHLVKNWGVPAEKIVVFPNVADVQRFRPDPEASRSVRASLGLDTYPLVIFVGNFYEWHDVATLLDAFAATLQAYPETRLILVGDGTRRSIMAERVSELGIGHAVQFTGMVPHDEVPRYLAAADIAVVPYPPMETELWLSPLKLFEYMASGKAVIASDVGQLAAIIQDGQNGLLVPPGDVPAMTDALVRLLGTPDLRSQLGQKARQDAVHEYSWEHYLSRLESLLAAVIEGKAVDHI